MGFFLKIIILIIFLQLGFIFAPVIMVSSASFPADICVCADKCYIIPTGQQCLGAGCRGTSAAPACPAGTTLTESIEDLFPPGSPLIPAGFPADICVCGTDCYKIPTGLQCLNANCVGTSNAQSCPLGTTLTERIEDLFPERPASLPTAAPTKSTIVAPGNENCVIEAGQEVCKLTNPLKGDVKDVPTLIGMVIKAALGVVGALSLFVFIQGGFTWLTSLGNAERVKKGGQIMVWAVLGLILTFASYLILNTLFSV